MPVRVSVVVQATLCQSVDHRLSFFFFVCKKARRASLCFCLCVFVLLEKNKRKTKEKDTRKRQRKEHDQENNQDVGSRSLSVGFKHAFSVLFEDRQAFFV